MNVGETIEEVKPDTEDDAALDTELAGQAIDDGKGNKMVPLSALVASKKEARSLGKKVKELEPVAGRAKEIEDRLGRVQPIIDAIVADPQLRAAATRVAQGKPTSDRVEQPTDADDPDAVMYAEAQGWYTAAGEVDATKARKVLDIFDRRSGRTAAEAVKPFAGMALGQRAESNLAAAAAQTDDDGVPLVTKESLKEVAAMLPPNLLADPNVGQLALTLAMGIDKQKKRTPKAPEEILVLDSASGRRGVDRVLSAEEKRIAGKVGLSDKDLAAADKQLESTATGRGVRLE